MVLSLLLALLATACGVDGSAVSGPAGAQLPSVTGLRAPAADLRLLAAGVSEADIEVSFRKSDPAQDGIVLEQRQTGRGDSVGCQLVVGSVRQVTVPKVVGVEQTAAVKSLSSAGFRISIVSRRADRKVAKGRVINQDPSAGRALDVGGLVRISVSTGPPLVKVPTLAGLAKDAALAAARKAGFATVTKIDTSDLPLGTVTRTDPVAGATVVEGSALTVFVSLGPPPTTVPPSTHTPTTRPTSSGGSHPGTSTSRPAGGNTPTPTTHCTTTYVEPTYGPSGEVIDIGGYQTVCR